jgi:iron complex transport system permease protein
MSSEAIKGNARQTVSAVSRPMLSSTLIIVGSAATLFFMMVSVAVGAADISLETVWSAIVHFDPGSTQHQIIRELRIPRTIMAGLVGAALAVSGSIMQGMTRNPLASPGLMGVSAGSAFFIILAFVLFKEPPYLLLMAFSFIGAFVGAALVYGTGSLARGGLTPVGLALAGAAVSALLGSLGGALNIFLELADDLMIWYAGGVAGTKWLHVNTMLPWVLAGFAGAIIISRSITVLSLGDEIAVGLGQKTMWVKAAGSIVVLVLTGAAVSTAGAVGFVGLMIPHVARYLIGTDYRWVIPCSAVLGGLLLVIADIAARMVNAPYETPIGVLTALIGVPFFLYLARRERSGM